eukprot:scaffold52316_cov54-Attheya_sp.AAC.1
MKVTLPLATLVLAIGIGLAAVTGAGAAVDVDLDQTSASASPVEEEVSTDIVRILSPEIKFRLARNMWCETYVVGTPSRTNQNVREPRAPISNLISGRVYSYSDFDLDLARARYGRPCIDSAFFSHVIIHHSFIRLISQSAGLRQHDGPNANGAEGGGGNTFISRPTSTIASNGYSAADPTGGDGSLRGDGGGPTTAAVSSLAAGVGADLPSRRNVRRAVSSIGTAAASVAPDPDISITAAATAAASSTVVGTTIADDTIRIAKDCNPGLAYGYEVVGRAFVSLEPPSGALTVRNQKEIDQPSDGSYYAGGAAGLPDDDFLYQLSATGSTLQKISKVTGEIIENLGQVQGNPQFTLTGLHMDLTSGILYGMNTICGTSSSLVSITPTIPPEATEIGPIGGLGTCFIALAIDADGNGWTYDVFDDNLYSVDLCTGEFAVVGPIGFDAHFTQGMAYDPASDTVYMAAYNIDLPYGQRAQLRSVDTSTGQTTLLDPIGPGTTEVNWLAFETCGEKTSKSGKSKCASVAGK